MPRPTTLPADQLAPTIAAVGLPSCVTPQCTYYHLGSPTPLINPKASKLHWLSISRFGRDVLMPVREYQPVVHRLRLSASP
jgi:hypothetical protein